MFAQYATLYVSKRLRKAQLTLFGGLKKIMKRLIICALAAGMAFSLFAGCGKEKAGAGTSGDGYVYSAPTEAEDFGIYVAPVEGIGDDFIRGVDISSVISEEQSGVVYYNQNGEAEDIFKILADAGVNYVRVRVWNDPYDKNGNGYGGGNCDADKAAEIGKRASAYGLKLLVDFHYSDFWADPGKQMVPKAWDGMSVEEKASACYDFTLETMNRILDAGADVGMVQLGNETNNGMSGETKWSDIAQIMNEGRRAVLEAGTAHGNDDILIAVHFTNPEDSDGIKGVLRKLESSGVKYDVFALSYYPYWHGTLENLTELMKYIVDTYGKKVMVAETSYAYTVEDGDGTGNNISQKDLNKNYAATVQSQANAVRDVFAATAAVGENALGVFYWEPAWIPVKEYVYGEEGAEAILASNKEAWEKYGSGWASSYATEYDPKDAGVYYGGSSWDNQAMFDHNGKALDSLYVFKYLKYGTKCDLKVEFANDFVLTVNPGAALEMPGEVEVHYNNSAMNGPAPIIWNEEQVAAVDTSKTGEYEVEGTFEDGTTIICTVKVAEVNWIQNPSFEDEDRSMWKFHTNGDTCTDFQKKETDAYTGEWAMHYWRQSAVEFTAETTITDLENGTYYLSMYTQGGDSGSGAEMYLYAKTSEGEFKTPYSVNGWCDWQFVEVKGIEVTDGTITVGISFNGGEGAWGTFDDFYLCKEK